MKGNFESQEGYALLTSVDKENTTFVFHASRIEDRCGAKEPQVTHDNRGVEMLLLCP